MVVAVIPYTIAHSLISNIRIGKSLQSSRLTKSLLISLNIFSPKSLFKSFDDNFVAWVPLLLLANRRSIPPAKRQPRHLHNRAGSIPYRRRWSNSDGNSLRLRCCEFSNIQHELFYSPGDTKWRSVDRTATLADNRYDSREEEANGSWTT